MTLEKPFEQKRVRMLLDFHRTVFLAVLFLVFLAVFFAVFLAVFFAGDFRIENRLDAVFFAVFFGDFAATFFQR